MVLLQATMRPVYSEFEKSLVVTVYHLEYPVTEDILDMIFSSHGNIEKIEILSVKENFQAIVRYQSPFSAKSAQCLHGRCIFRGCNLLDIQYLSRSFLNQRFKEDVSTEEINNAGENEVVQDDSYVFDRIHDKEFKELEVKTTYLQVFDKITDEEFNELEVKTTCLQVFDDMVIRDVCVEKMVHNIKEGFDENQKITLESESGTALEPVQIEKHAAVQRSKGELEENESHINDGKAFVDSTHSQCIAKYLFDPGGRYSIIKLILSIVISINSGSVLMGLNNSQLTFAKDVKIYSLMCVNDCEMFAGFFSMSIVSGIQINVGLVFVLISICARICNRHHYTIARSFLTLTTLENVLTKVMDQMLILIVGVAQGSVIKVHWTRMRRITAGNKCLITLGHNNKNGFLIWFSWELLKCVVSSFTIEQVGYLVSFWVYVSFDKNLRRALNGLEDFLSQVFSTSLIRNGPWFINFIRSSCWEFCIRWLSTQPYKFEVINLLFSLKMLYKLKYWDIGKNQVLISGENSKQCYGCHDRALKSCFEMYGYGINGNDFCMHLNHIMDVTSEFDEEIGAKTSEHVRIIEMFRNLLSYDYKHASLFCCARITEGLIHRGLLLLAEMSSVDVAKGRLRSARYEQISKNEDLELEAGKKSFCTRNRFTIVAFTIGKYYVVGNGISLIGAHADSPFLGLEPNSEVSKDGYLEVGVHTYGGGLWYTWFDIDLTIARRIIVRKQKDGVESYSHHLIKIDDLIMCIPTLAIHLDMDVNDGFKVNKETHIAQILATPVNEKLNKPTAGDDYVETGSNDEENIDGKTKAEIQKHHSLLWQLIVAQAGCEPNGIYNFESQVCGTQKSAIAGAMKQSTFSRRLDNLWISSYSIKVQLDSTFLGDLVHEYFVAAVQIAEKHSDFVVGFISVNLAPIAILLFTLKFWIIIRVVWEFQSVVVDVWVSVYWKLTLDYKRGSGFKFR